MGSTTDSRYRQPGSLQQSGLLGSPAHKQQHNSSVDGSPAITELILACPPWPPIDSPSLALGTLASYVHKLQPLRTVVQDYSYLPWYAVLLAEFGSDRGAQLYATVSGKLAYSQAGDYIFGRELFGYGAEDNHRFMELIGSSLSRGELERLQDLAELFVADTAERLVSQLGDRALLGLSSTFVQTVAGLALAKAVKERRPGVVTMLGGAALNVSRGELLLDRFTFLDAVVFGEGEQTLADSLSSLDRTGGLAAHSGLCFRGRAGQPVVGEPPPMVAMNSLPPPDPAPYFEQMRSSRLSGYFSPTIAYEIGRGCWWGEKHHCTFCGLNGDSMAFRRKSGGHVAKEVEALVDTHRVLDIFFVDNILHPRDIQEVFAELDREYDLRMHLEVKANLKYSEMLQLREAGVWHMQPGIESFSRRPLELMRKGVTPLLNVRFLRSAEELGITASWNLLTGFPGETDPDYDDMIGQLPQLHHLQPPGGSADVEVVPNSPLFSDPTLGIRRVQPSASNVLTFKGMSADEVATISEVFDVVEGDIGTFARRELLASLCEDWIARYPTSQLWERFRDDGIEIVRERDGEVSVVRIEEPVQMQLWHALRPGRTAKGARQAIEQLWPQDSAAGLAVLERWTSNDLLYRDAGGAITLPCRYESHHPVKVSGLGRVCPPATTSERTAATTVRWEGW